jgi:hypothetical protein
VIMRLRRSMGTSRRLPIGWRKRIRKLLHRLNLHLSKAIGLVGRAKLSGVAEVFTVYNHANYGRYKGFVTSPTYGQPLQSTATAHLPRIWQLAFRVGF